MIAEAADSYGHFEQLIEREGIDCPYRRSGRFVGAHTPAAYAGMAKSVQNLNAHAEAGAFLVPRERQREQLASDYYYGGMVVRSEEHTSELQSLMRISYAVFCLKKQKIYYTHKNNSHQL